MSQTKVLIFFKKHANRPVNYCDGKKTRPGHGEVSGLVSKSPNCSCERFCGFA